MARAATAASNNSWTNRLLNNTRSLGNTGQSILHKVSELLNDYCKTDKEIDDIAERAGLCPSTIKRLMELKPTEEGNEYNPFGDTMSRVLLVFGAAITWSQVRVEPQYMPQKKRH